MYNNIHLRQRFRVLDSTPVVDLVHLLHVPGQRTLPSHPLAVLAPNPGQLQDLPSASLHMAPIHVTVAFSAKHAHDLMGLKPPLAVEPLVADLAAKLEKNRKHIKNS